MKKNIRQITIDQHIYVYVLHSSYQQERWQVSLKITLLNQKNTALIFHFLTWDDIITGCPLLVGIKLYDCNIKEAVMYNLNHPARVRELIEYGLSYKWTGEKTVEYADGLIVLEDIGYDSDILRPQII